MQQIVLVQDPDGGVDQAPHQIGEGHDHQPGPGPAPSVGGVEQKARDQREGRHRGADQPLPEEIGRGAEMLSDQHGMRPDNAEGEQEFQRIDRRQAGHSAGMPAESGITGEEMWQLAVAARLGRPALPLIGRVGGGLPASRRRRLGRAEPRHPPQADPEPGDEQDRGVAIDGVMIAAPDREDQDRPGKKPGRDRQQERALGAIERHHRRHRHMHRGEGRQAGPEPLATGGVHAPQMLLQGAHDRAVQTRVLQVAGQRRKAGTVIEAVMEHRPHRHAHQRHDIAHSDPGHRIEHQEAAHAPGALSSPASRITGNRKARISQGPLIEWRQADQQPVAQQLLQHPPGVGIAMQPGVERGERRIGVIGHDLRHGRLDQREADMQRQHPGKDQPQPPHCQPRRRAAPPFGPERPE